MLGLDLTNFPFKPCSVLEKKQCYRGLKRCSRYSKILGRLILVALVTASMMKEEECMKP